MVGIRIALQYCDLLGMLIHIKFFWWDMYFSLHSIPYVCESLVFFTNYYLWELNGKYIYT